MRELSLLIPPLLLSIGCVAQVDINDDPDADGLSDGDELRLGSNPSVADSDDDGYADGAEAAVGADPADPADHPFQAGWQMDACRNSIESTGNADGQVAENFALMDQFGETVHLHDFCDQVVYVNFSAMWCGNCQAEAQTMEARYQGYVGKGVMFVEVMIEDVNNGEMDIDELNQWVDTYGLTLPVVSDPGSATMWTYLGGNGTVGLPAPVLIDRGSVVASTNYPTDADIDALIGE